MSSSSIQGTSPQDAGSKLSAPLNKADVAVVVPTRNSASTLRVCLESIKAQSHPCTLIVVDNGSTDDTTLIAEELADLVLACGPERSAQRNAGAAATSAVMVGFIDSDMELPLTVVGEAVDALVSGAASVVVPERTVGEGFWTEVRAFERTFYQESDAIEAPRFYRRDVFDSVCGFDEAMTGPEDWDLGIRTHNAGPRARSNSVILHHEGRVRYLNACRKKGYYGPGLARFAAKHGASGLLGVAQREWLKHPRELCTPLGVGLVALKGGESIAIVAAIAKDRFAHKSRRYPSFVRDMLGSCRCR